MLKYCSWIYKYIYTNTYRTCIKQIYATRVYTVFQTRMLLNGNIRICLLKIIEDFFATEIYTFIYINITKAISTIYNTFINTYIDKYVFKNIKWITRIKMKNKRIHIYT